MDFRDYIRTIPDYPMKGIMFRDITTLMENGPVYREAILKLSDYARSVGADVIVGPEARGFMMGCPVAYELGLGFVPVRKPGKLPYRVVTETYEKEYGSDILCIHEDAIKPGQRVVIVDDLLATGGTMAATIDLVGKVGGSVVGCAFLIDLVDLHEPACFGDVDVFALAAFEGE
jgi:adenine phosphoribosyltransferase